MAQIATPARSNPIGLPPFLCRGEFVIWSSCEAVSWVALGFASLATSGKSVSAAVSSFGAVVGSSSDLATSEGACWSGCTLSASHHLCDRASLSSFISFNGEDFEPTIGLGKPLNGSVVGSVMKAPSSKQDHHTFRSQWAPSHAFCFRSIHTADPIVGYMHWDLVYASKY